MFTLNAPSNQILPHITPLTLTIFQSDILLSSPPHPHPHPHPHPLPLSLHLISPTKYLPCSLHGSFGLRPALPGRLSSLPYKSILDLPQPWWPVAVEIQIAPIYDLPCPISLSCVRGAAEGEGAEDGKAES